MWSFGHRPSFGVSIHCLTVFVARLILRCVVTLWMRRRGLHEIQVQSLRGHARTWACIGVHFLSVWIPIRLMNPGTLLCLGRWTCQASASVLPPSLDIFTMAAKSHHFWIVFAWAEIALFLGLLYLMLALSKWDSWNFLPFLGGWLGRLKQRIHYPHHGRTHRISVSRRPSDDQAAGGVAPRNSEDRGSVTRNGVIYQRHSSSEIVLGVGAGNRRRKRTPSGR